MAWFIHTRLQDHHWQYWVLATEGEEKLYEMKPESIVEMFCDWIGAGRAQGTTDTLGWWNANKPKMRIHENSLKQIEKLLETK
jgi:hypothetical protein